MCLPILEDLLTAHVDGGDGWRLAKDLDPWSRQAWPPGGRSDLAFGPDCRGHPLSEWAPLPLEQELGQ